jgi:hypothetical protein
MDGAQKGLAEILARTERSKDFMPTTVRLSIL